jgi:hypothetical protein
MNAHLTPLADGEDLTWTELPNKTGITMTKHSGSWPEFVDRLKTVGTFPTKEKCPWFKLATFGDKRSRKGSLRHNANVLTITGLEADYDGEVVAMATAKEQLERHGIRAALYQSPSSTPEKPRWRVVCPLSAPHAPGDRERLVARLNGALGGVLAGESFTLSQGYYFGATPTNYYRVLVTFDDPDDGTCIDQLDDLDELAIGKSWGSPPSKEGKMPPPPSALVVIVSDQTIEDLRSALKSIDAGDRPLWVRLGHALKTLGEVGRDLWLEWSATSKEKFDEIEALKTWETFRPTSTGYQAVFAEAQRSGWINPASNSGGRHIADASDFECLNEVLSPAALGDPASAETAPPATFDATYPPPFRGAMSDIVKAVLAVSIKPQPDICTLSALIGMAASCNGIYGLPSGMRLNLFACCVAGTGEGKEHPRSIATAITKAAGGALIGKPASGPGLEDSLESSTGSLIALDEIAHFFAAINSGKAPPHLIELAGTLLQLFSASRGDFHTRVRAKANGTTPSRCVRNPVVSLLGFATPEKLGEAMGVSNIEDGLLGRFLFAFGQLGVTPRRINDSWGLPDSAVTAAEAVRQAFSLELLTGNKDVDCIKIAIDPAAETRLGELLVDFDRQRQKAQSAFAKALLARSCEKCERVAGVLAVWDSPRAPVVAFEHVEWAAQLLFASDAALLRFSGEYMHGGQTQANAQGVLKLIKRSVAGDFKPQKKHESGMLRKGIAPHTMVMRNSKLAKRDFDDAVAHLVDLGEVELFSTSSPHPNGREQHVRGFVMRI